MPLNADDYVNKNEKKKKTYEFLMTNVALFANSVSTTTQRLRIAR